MGLAIFIGILFMTIILRTVILNLLMDKRDASKGTVFIKKTFADAVNGFKYIFGRFRRNGK